MLNSIYTRPWVYSRRLHGGRSLDAMNLQETGKWYVCLQLMYSGWNTTYYSGDLAITFRYHNFGYIVASIETKDLVVDF